MADKTVVVRIALRGNEFSQGMARAASDTQKFAADVSRGTQQAASSTMALGAASATAGKAILLGIGGAMVVSAKAAIDFESSMAGVAKTTDLAGNSFDKANTPLAVFGQGIRNLSLRIPLNANELARIAELGGQLGIATPNLIQFTEVIAALGVSTDLSTEQAATGLARIANIMGTSESKFENLGASIVALGNNLATTESEILNFALRIAPVGATVGATEDEVFALAGALTSLGVPAERGGTAIQRLFIDISGAVDSAGESLADFAAVAHMTPEAFAGLFRESPARAFQALVEGLNQIQESGGSAFATLRELDIQEQRTIQVLLAAASGYETVAEAIEIANEAGQDGNALFQEAARRYETTESQIRLVSNAFNDLRIEIGNALLSSGGLAGGLDFLREFFGVVKDNLGTIQAMVVILSGLAALRLASGLGTMASRTMEMARGFRAASAGAQAMSASMRAAQVASLALNTAIFAGIGIISIIATSWAMAAADAAKLRGQVRSLREEMDSGVEVGEAFANILGDEGILTPEIVTLLNDAGVSVSEFAESMLIGGKTAQDMKDDIRDFFTIAPEDMFEPGTGGRQLTEEAKEMQSALSTLDRALGDTEKIASEFRTNIRTDLRNVFFETGLAAEYTEEEMQDLIDRAIELFGIDISTSQFANFLTSRFDLPIEGLHIARRLTEDIANNTGTWMDRLGQTESGPDQIEAFFKGITKTIDGFNEFLNERMEEINDTIFGGFPAWGEYEQVVVESLEEIRAAQAAYVEDIIAGMALERDLRGQVSDDVLGVFEAMDPATKAGLARFRETNRAEFDAWIAEMEGQFQELHEVAAREWLDRLPETAREGFDQMVAEAFAVVDQMDIPAEDAGEAYAQALNEQMALLPARYRDDFFSYIMTSLSHAGGMYDEGVNIGNAFIDGLAGSLSNMAVRLNDVIIAEMGKVKTRMREEAEVESPSKFTFWIGEMMGEGLFGGIEHSLRGDRISKLFRPHMNHILQAANHTTINVPRQPVGDISLAINNPRTKDLSRDLQRSELILTDLIHLVERGF